MKRVREKKTTLERCNLENLIKYSVCCLHKICQRCECITVLCPVAKVSVHFKVAHNFLEINSPS